MAKTADYIVMEEEMFSIDKNPTTGAKGEHRVTVRIPSAIDLTDEKQRPVLMFVARTSNGSINVEIDLNARRVMNLKGFESPLGRTIHRVIPLNFVNAGQPNNFLFRVVDAQSNETLFHGSDVILWFQREGFGGD